jgi:TolC family type I secretion outer membrane protein
MNLALARLMLASLWLSGSPGARAEPLAAMLAKVYQVSPQLESGRARLRAFDESVPQALAAGRPQATVTSSAAFNAAGEAQPTQRQALNVSQSLYDGGATRAATRLAENGVRAERGRLMLLEQDVLLEAVMAYTAVARDRQVLDLAGANEERLRLQLDATRDRERYGDVTRTDIFQAESRHAGAIAARVAAEGDLKVSTAEYQRLTGAAPGRLELPPLPDAVPVSLDEALAQADASWQWQVATFELAAARDEVSVSLADLKPNLSLGGQVGYAMGDGGYDGSGGNASIGATLTVPLYRGGGEYARVRQSKEVLSQRRHGRDDARRRVEAAITAAWEAMRTAEAAIRSIQRQVDAAAFALDGVRQEALVGARTVLDVLDAEQELFAAEVDLVRAGREQVLAAYRLRAAIGRLTARDLELEVAH